MHTLSPGTREAILDNSARHLMALDLHCNANRLLSTAFFPSGYSFYLDSCSIAHPAEQVQDWEILAIMQKHSGQQGTYKASHLNPVQDGVTISIVISRVSKPYVRRVVAPLMFLNLLGSLGFFIPNNDISSKFGYNVTIFLSILALLCVASFISVCIMLPDV